MGKLTISMAIFNSYVKLPEGKYSQFDQSLSCLAPQVWAIVYHNQI